MEETKKKGFNTSSNSYTILYSVVIVVIVAFLLAFVSSSLKPQQDENVALDKKKQILAALNIRDIDGAEATDIYNKVKETGSVIITKVATKRKVEKAPLLYDLTTLQKEANSQHGFTAEHTLSIAQKLYEAKFITYPRTSSRYISDDVFATLPKLFKNLENHSEYGEKVKLLPGSEDYSKNCVNAAKVTDHHALLITENAAIGLFKDEKERTKTRKMF